MDNQIQAMNGVSVETIDADEWGPPPDAGDWGDGDFATNPDPLVPEDGKLSISGKSAKSDQINKGIMALGFRYGKNLRTTRGMVSRNDGPWEELDENEGSFVRSELNKKIVIAKPDKKGNISFAEFLPTLEMVRGEIANLQRENQFDPFRDYLDDLHTTQIERDDADNFNTRADTFLMEVYPDIEDTQYNRALIRNIVLPAVARAYEPGCKSDIMTIIHGAQGCGKDAVFENLVPEPTLTNSGVNFTMTDEKLFEAVTGAVFAHMSDLGGVQKKDVETLKGMMTNRFDTNRKKYRENPAIFPRMYHPVGSSNKQQSLPIDASGHRRFGVLRTNTSPDTRCPTGPVEPTIAAMRDDVWSAAVALYRMGFRPGLPTDLIPAQIEMNAGEEYSDSVLVDTYDEALMKKMLDCRMPFNDIARHLGLVRVGEKLMDRHLTIRLENLLERNGWAKSPRKLRIRKGENPRAAWLAPESLGLPDPNDRK